MDINYHYFVTYQAAIEAGFPVNEAKIIARASQFVDENSESFVQNFKKKNPKFESGTVCYTSQTPDELLKGEFIDSFTFWRKNRTEVLKIARIWPIFHFLPGDYDFVNDSIKPEFETAHKIEKYGSHLICGPESSLVKALVNEAEKYVNKNYSMKNLLRIGITMHVLADTFAHQRFVGLPSSELNDVAFVIATDGYGLEPLDEAEWRLGKDDKGNKRVYSPAPIGSHSFGYLGHGRIGHMPDEPGVVFGYHPSWDKNEPPKISNVELESPDDPIESYVYRANYIEFLSAYEQMIAAMKFIRGATDDFNEKVDKSKYDMAQIYDPHDSSYDVIVDEKEEILRLQQLINIFASAKKDSELKDLWCEHFKITDAEYTPPADYTDIDFVKIFNIEAENHQRFVIEQTPTLIDLIHELII